MVVAKVWLISVSVLNRKRQKGLETDFCPDVHAVCSAIAFKRPNLLREATLEKGFDG